MARTTIKALTPSLSWLSNLLALFSSKEIAIPTGFREQAHAVEEILENDCSGLVNSILDFGISTASSIDYNVESSNKTLTKVLNNWLKSINSSLRGQIPVGIEALSKEYYKERWKGSSFLLLRTVWEDIDGFYLPTKLWFVDGKDVEISGDDEETKIIGQQSFGLIIGKDKTIPLPTSSSEIIFTQRPYERWHEDYPTPYLIKRGVYYNLKFLEGLIEKGSSVVGKALEYLMLMKKGNPELAKLNLAQYTYSEEDLKAVKEGFQKLVNDKNMLGGVPTYTTNFDTELEHLIPDYKLALESGLYSPIERRILAGLGFIEVVEGITSTRRDSILNPKVFVSEVQDAVNDFKSLMTDVIMTAIELNRGTHRKLTNAEMIQLRTSPLKSFYSTDLLDFLRTMYDRGLISKRTMVELGVDIDFDAEIERRKEEQKDGLDQKYETTMFPPITQNIDEQMGKNASPSNTNTTVDKQGPEAKNYNQN